MKLTSPLIANPQGTPFTYIEFTHCKECGEYDADMVQTKKIDAKDINLFSNNIPVFIVNAVCWDCFLK